MGFQQLKVPSMTHLVRNGTRFIVVLALAASLGLMLFGLALRLLMGDAASTAAMAETLQVRRWQPRTLALIQSDLARAASLQIIPVSALRWLCAGSGRQPRLAITLRCLFCCWDLGTSW